MPGVLALLPAYASITDPVADLRAAALAALAPLGPDPVVLGDPQGQRVVRALLAELPAAPARDRPAGADVVVVGNGTACRSEKAPGHLDPRAHDLDAALGAWLRGRGPRPDLDLADTLWASTAGLRAWADLPVDGEPEVLWDDDPVGVQWWVVRWVVRWTRPETQEEQT